MADPNNALIADHCLVLMFVCKAANTSIKHAIGDAVRLPDYGLPADEFAPHRKFDLYFPTPNKLSILRLKQENYRVIGFARHPLARVVSCYKNKIRDRLHKPFTRKYGNQVWQNMPFQSWCEFLCQVPDGISDQHFRSASWGMIGDDGRLIPDRIFRVDDQNWWDELRNDLIEWSGLDIGSERFANKTDGKDWQSFYTPELRKSVSDRYATDLRVFSYDA